MSISIILPVFNEALNIDAVLCGINDIVRSLNTKYEIIVVDDGSIDETAKILSTYKADQHFHVIHHSKNMGYGQALRSGFEAAKYEWTFFMDADRQFDFGEIQKLIPYTNTADFIIGYRKKRNDPLRRSVNSKIYNIAVRLLFGLWVKDLNCAFKLMRTSMIQSFKLNTGGALINAEILVNARRRKYRIVEVPVSHYPRKGGSSTGSNFGVIKRAFVELIRFRLKKYD